MANYLPVLIGSVNAIPDDTALSDLPRGQVDYLSHNWREEDVWRSWRNMTRLKNEIANGMRLENASWRTWWKQRNKLKTVSPETLNWLKDSDVTWLYGPLHTADHELPKPSPKASPAIADALDLPATTKPILKHRSICELLTSDMPTSPLFSSPESEEEELHVMSDGDVKKVDGMSSSGAKAQRPALLHVKSDTHIMRWGPNRAFRRDSPPRIIAAGGPPAKQVSDGQPLVDSSRESTAQSIPPKRKHISFNTFVEQRIAIEKPNKAGSYGFEYARQGHVNSSAYEGTYSFDDDGYDEDSEDGAIDEGDELILFGDDAEPDVDPSNRFNTRSSVTSHPQSHIHPALPSSGSHALKSPPPTNPTLSHSSSSSTSDDEEDDDVLEMRVRHPPTPARPSSHRSSSSSTSSSSRSRPSGSRSNSCSNPHQQPRSGASVSSSYHPLMRTPSADKELITIAFIAPTTLKTRTEDGDESDDDLHSRYRYSQQPARGDKWYTYGVKESPVELVYVPPSYTRESDPGVYGDAMRHDGRSEGVYHHRESYFTVDGSVSSVGLAAQFFDDPLVASPNEQSDSHDEHKNHFEKGPKDTMDIDADVGIDGVVRYTQGGAASVPTGRSRSSMGPEVIVSGDVEEDGRTRSRSRSRSQSRSRSRSRTPSPNMITTVTSHPSTVPATILSSSAAVPVPRPSASHITTSPTLLSPPEPPRGRSVSSPTLSSQASIPPPARGRSISRTSSFSSDRDRNSSGPTGSPFGSLSPDGFGLGIGTGYAGGRERDSAKEGRKNAERGRDRRRVGSGSNSSVSPDDHREPEKPVPSPVVVVSKPSIEQKRYASSSSGSSTVSTASTTRPPPRLVVDAKPITKTDLSEMPSVPLSSPILDEQELLSRQPTPANSPIMSMHPTLPPTSPLLSSYGRKTPCSPVRDDFGAQRPLDPGGTLVGRAVEIMSNAGAFLGSFWHSGSPVSTP